MVFNSDIFLFGFLPVVFTLFWLLKDKNQRYILLTLSSYVFYGYWNWRFCGLLLFSSLVSYFTGILISASPQKKTKRRWMILSVSLDLCLLGFFKYYNFLTGSLPPSWRLPSLHLLLPIGISFYTFHTISYICDVTAGRVKATRNLWEYLAYVSLFSQLVAGPIVRFRQIEDDLERIDQPIREENIAKGIGFFVVGLAKKAIIADRIAHQLNPFLATYRSFTMAGAWIAALGYAYQIYFDFSGYSDMAVGLGYLFGLRIPQNFDAPYRAASVSDFWRRWHMSLSSWLKDYLYIPLGGNRKGAPRTYVNLFVTMLLGGLWHGANWTFVVWGAYHGCLLVLNRAVSGLPVKVPLLLRRIVTFALIVISWVLFRSDDLAMAKTWLGKMLAFRPSLAGAPKTLLFYVLFCLIVTNALPETWNIRFSSRRRWAVAYAICFVITYLFMNNSHSYFIYYQF